MKLVSNITFWDVRGTGKATQERICRSIAYDTSTIERILITFVCREKYMDPAIMELSVQFTCPVHPSALEPDPLHVPLLKH
jgi:hypothetical protein